MGVEDEAFSPERKARIRFPYGQDMSNLCSQLTQHPDTRIVPQKHAKLTTSIMAYTTASFSHLHISYALEVMLRTEYSCIHI